MSKGPVFKPSRLLCPAAVLWCSGSHIYGVSEGQRRLLPGSARCLCRRVKRQPRHPSDTLEPPEGHLPEPALTRPGWGNSTRCTLPLSASAWPESRWNQPCFSFFPPFLSFDSKAEAFSVVSNCPPLSSPAPAEFSRLSATAAFGFFEPCRSIGASLFSSLSGLFCLTSAPRSRPRF